MAYYLDEDTRSDTTRQGYYEGQTPKDAGSFQTWGANYNPIASSQTQQFAINPWFLPDNPQTFGKVLEIANGLKKYVKNPKNILETTKDLVNSIGKEAPVITNQINNQAELAAYEDFQKYSQELKAKGIDIPLVSSTRPRGRLPFKDTRYPDHILEGLKPKERKAIISKEGITGRSIQKGISKSEKAARYARDKKNEFIEDLDQRTASKKAKWKHSQDLAWATGDLRHVNSGRPKDIVKRFISVIDRYPTSNQKVANRLRINVEKAATPEGRKQAYLKLKEYVEEITKNDKRWLY